MVGQVKHEVGEQCHGMAGGEVALHVTDVVI